MPWLIVALLACGASWIWFKVIPDLVSEFDYRARFMYVKEFLAANPQHPDESNSERIRRATWHSLKMVGLPPLVMFQRRLKHGKPIILAPPDLVARYILEDAPLPDGKPDTQIANGHALVIHRLWADECQLKGQAVTGAG
jgi:hypothetical protein